ncbi:MAG: NAD(P)H-dependent oxidoreductase [Alphaproteobacteria bacterium]|nr:NAD(P)H-dependent oxidoreductase [Alphaproteobacteria bacterium]
MKVLIVHAHPEPRSFCAAMKDMAVAELRARGDTVEVSDLYAMHFDPVARGEDFRGRENPDYLVYAMEQRHGWQARTLAPDILAEVEKLQWCDFLLLSFPMFWGGVPAIMKGWFDRVLLSGPFYGGKRFYDRGGLSGRRAMLAMTLGARPHMLEDERSVHGALDTALRPVQRMTLAYVGFAVLPPFVAWHVPYVTDEARRAILDDYRARLRGLDALAPLRFPRLDEFDDRLNPLAGG